MKRLKRTSINANHLECYFAQVTLLLAPTPYLNAHQDLLALLDLSNAGMSLVLIQNKNRSVHHRQTPVLP
jgi:hypothetical protein